MKKLILASIMILLMSSLVAHVWAQRPSPTTTIPSKIVFGQALSLSGRFAPNATNLEQLAIALWLQEVNAKGGIYVKKYNKRLPVELIRYDDKSDVNNMIQLVNKLITEDKVDFLLPPHGTDMHFAACPIANKNGYPLVIWTAASEKLLEGASNLPYVFHAILDYRQRYGDLKDIIEELGVKNIALIYIQGLMGIEISKYLAPAVEAAGVKIVINKSYPILTPDLSPILKQIKGENVDALIAISYPSDTLLITEQSMVIGLNPKLFFVGIGGAMPIYRDKFGALKLEGVMSEGGWSPRLSPEAKEYFAKYKSLNGKEPDYFSAPTGYASYQVYELAIEKAGTLDREKVKEVMATETFMTVYGPIKFKNQVNIQSPSNIGQWQKGIFEAIGPKKTRTAQPIYPKPHWP